MTIADFSVHKADVYKKAEKQLLKRFRHLNTDVKSFLLSIEIIDDLGVSLGNGFYKARIANSDKNKGKSAGYRLVTLLQVIETTIYLVYIYDKSDLENISESELDALIVGMS